jgi:hypothetical protein
MKGTLSFLFALSIYGNPQLHAQVKRVTTSVNQVQIEITKATPIRIKWVANLNGNFSFRHKWEYPEGVFRNKYGQISCDGFCPDEIESMMDKNGKIIRDSLKAFYKLVDTAHIPYSISSSAWCYEWSGTEFIDAIKKILIRFF